MKSYGIAPVQSLLLCSKSLTVQAPKRCAEVALYQSKQCSCMFIGVMYCNCTEMQSTYELKTRHKSRRIFRLNNRGEV